MKSAIGIGALLMDGLGDTIRVSLTEDPELEINPCRCSLCPVCAFRARIQAQSTAMLYPPTHRLKAGECAAHKQLLVRPEYQLRALAVC